MTDLRLLVAAVVGVCSIPAIVSVAVMLEGASKGVGRSDIADWSIANRRTLPEDIEAPHYGRQETVKARLRAEDKPDWPFIRNEGELRPIEKASTRLAREMIYLDVIGQADDGDRSILADFKNGLSPRFRLEFIEFHLQYKEDFKRYAAAQWHKYKEAHPGGTGKPSRGGRSSKNATGNSQGKCDVRYYNEKFGYGFDLPTVGDPVTDPTPGDKELKLFRAGWIFRNLGPEFVVVGTTVRDLQHIEEVESLSWFADTMSAVRGFKLLRKASITLSNGDPGALRISYGVTEGVGVVRYQVTTIKDNRYFGVVAIMPADSFTLLSDGLLTRIVGSLCVD